MKIWKKAGALLLAAIIAGSIASPAAAKEEREKITKVTLSFTAYDSGDDGEYGAVEVTSDSGPYGVDEVEFLSSTSASSYPRVRITMYADEDAYFASSGQSLFDLDGEGATFVSATRKESNSCVVLTVQLRKYSGAIANVPEGVDWAQAGIGTWDAVPNTAYYEVRLRRGTATIGDILKIEDTRCDLTSMIDQTGSYSFQVRSVNLYMTSRVSKWVSSDRLTVDEALLHVLQEQGGSFDSGVGSGWQKDTVGYWYRDSDGTWPAACWRKIDGCWYYFNADGYMVANNWVHDTDDKWYYLGDSGAMLTNTRTPDGFYVDADGIYIPGK